MFDHLTLQVTDMAVSRDFYTTLLAPLGIRPSHVDGAGIGFFSESAAGGFWLCPAETRETRELHFAFTAPTRHLVREFHGAGIRAGGKSIYAPQPFPQYHAHYYAAFVRDPDGHSVEAVCHYDISD